MIERLRTALLLGLFTAAGGLIGGCLRNPCIADPLRRECVISDTTEDLWPEPADRTRAHLNYLAGQIGAHFQRTGQLPSSLHELFPGGAGEELGRFRLDAWQREVIYTALGRGRFELRSGGADGKPGTADDIVIAGEGAGSGA